MDIVNELGLVSTTELTIISLSVYFLIQSIKISKINIPNTYLPFLAMVVGTVIGIIIAKILGGSTLSKAGLAGFLIGGFTSGLFTGFKGITGGYRMNDKH